VTVARMIIETAVVVLGLALVDELKRMQLAYLEASLDQRPRRGR
jgi:hypothetical protein